MKRSIKIPDSRITDEVLACLAGRGHDSSACPSEIARALAPGGDLWRGLMPQIRKVVCGMADAQQVILTRGSAVLATDALEGGPIRIRRGLLFR